MMKIKWSAAFAMLLLFSVSVMAQDATPENWHHLGAADGFPGINSEALYKRLLSDKKGETVIVAVIDSGVDYEHEDLDDVMWVNPGEIAGNGIDDDKNGYIDDIHGWNFIGNANGENISHDNLEVTRLYAKLKPMYDGKDKEDIKKKNMEEYELYQEVKQIVEDKRSGLVNQVTMFEGLKNALDKLKEELDTEEPTVEDLQGLETDDPQLGRLKQILIGQMQGGLKFADFEEQIMGGYDYYNSSYNYHYNPEFEPRSLVGDNYSDKEDSNYGNNDVRGPDSMHGTHVAGIIAAERNNDIGMDGVAANVQIMSVRTVPDGDERDKDVANAIRYAVDNGASIINMSFGKGYSPYKGVVDDAIKYARKNDVLLVHAAGNDGKENDNTNNYPNDKYSKRGFLGLGAKTAENWLEVGALNWEGGESLAASFSNYSSANVDVFAPGTEIYATVPGNKYQRLQGTSMAAPVVAGIAAVLRSYFPDLTAEQVKEVIMESTEKKSDAMVKQPGSGEMVKFSELSVTGGTVSLERAVEQALKTKGKKSGKSRILKATDLKKKPSAQP